MTVREITFTQLENWTYPDSKTHQYGYINDEEIKACIDSEAAGKHDLDSSWDTFGSYSTKSDNPIHCERVAALVVQLLEKGTELDPIKINAKNEGETCEFCVTDGHHRLRAYKYLGIKQFKARLEGDNQALNKLINNR